jgi:phosphoribosyl 1,2-cyclic phosphodiesterase
MKFRLYASSSEGNLYSLNDGQTSILIECGVPYNEMTGLIGYPPTSFMACLVSHAHKDHSKSVKELVRRGVAVCCSEDTARATGILNHSFSVVLKPERETRIGTFDVMPFECQHLDVGSGNRIPCFGYLIRSRVDGESMVFATDTFYLPVKFPPIQIWAVECNWATDLVPLDCPYRDRLFQSHMGLHVLIDALRQNDLSRCREIHLIHISKSHGDPERFVKEIEAATGIPTYAAPRNIRRVP